ncbi:integrase [Sphingobium sp. B11D3B]|uniref:tyrosine-type recombinase/integrase n=1 Tax=Sphingobium sp. B11D3B TaxID=2940575 RepID=UPI0022263500|nr:site-specific integrase [Sphingobium sp. B11D3B]MCW2387182.1 integrase [Sphingobium sp. B11D3B]
MHNLVFSNEGKRKYLTAVERSRLLASASSMSPHIATLCWTVAVTGLRISEALALSAGNIDFENRMIVTRCLKKRQPHVFRAIPIPDDLIEALIAVHGIKTNGVGADGPLWPVSRMTAYRWIRHAMKLASIMGPHAMPKGLRHGFGVCAIQSGVPLNMVQRWLGHADIRTTAIYTHAVGPEERAIAAKMWSPDEFNSLATALV